MVNVKNLIIDTGLYTGTSQYAKLHGHGVLVGNKDTSSDVVRYEGYFCQDKMHIMGTINFKNGDIYDGEIKQNQPRGFGTLVKAHGTKMIGIWDHGSLSDNSLSEIHYADGSHFKGMVTSTNPHGPGELRMPDGSVYKGNFDNGQKSGQGTLELREGDQVKYSYQGEWQHGHKHGEGIEIDGPLRYKGDFSMGVKQGSGRLEHSNDGWWYEGDFKQDKPHGLGTEQLTCGTNYRGQFKDGEKEGYGTCQYPDGTAYDGEWVAGKRHGEGIVFTADGDSYQGVFLFDKPVED